MTDRADRLVVNLLNILDGCAVGETVHRVIEFGGDRIVAKKSGKRRRRNKRKPARRETPQNRPPVILPPWFTDDSVVCPCGSGDSFRVCCKASLAEPSQIGAPVNDDEVVLGIRRWRAELSRYVSWVHSHTIPITQRASGGPINLIARTDIDALDTIIERLIWFLDKGGQQTAVVPLLDHIASSVPLPGLGDRILAIKAVWVDAKLGNADHAREMLKDVDPTTTTDGPLLRAFLGTMEAKSHLSRLELLARIIETSNEPVIRLQYGSLLALELWMMGENEKARRTIDDAIASGVPNNNTELDVYHAHWIARAHSFRWRIAEDPQDAIRAHAYYDRIPTEELNSLGKAALHAEIGMLHIDTGEYAKAAEYYARAYEDDPNIATCIHLSEACLKSGQTERANDLLATLDADTLPHECKLEYWDVSGLVAIAAGDRAQLDAVLLALRSLQLEPQYFASVRDRLCLELNEAFDKQEPAADTPQHRGARGLLAVLRLIGQNVEFKPNVFGIGVDLNKLIERFLGSDSE